MVIADCSRDVMVNMMANEKSLNLFLNDYQPQTLGL